MLDWLIQLILQVESHSEVGRCGGHVWCRIIRAKIIAMKAHSGEFASMNFLRYEILLLWALAPMDLIRKVILRTPPANTSSRQRPSILCNPAKGGLPLSLLQLDWSLKRSPYLPNWIQERPTWLDSHSWRWCIMQVTRLIQVSWRAPLFEAILSQR